METKLKVGDRVKLIGYDADGCLVEGLIGIVERLKSHGGAEVSVGPNSYSVTQNQCKRLKSPRERREWTIRGVREGGCLIYHGPPLKAGEEVTVQEVKRSEK
jgi:hypothetical protein